MTKNEYINRICGVGNWKPNSKMERKNRVLISSHATLGLPLSDKYLRQLKSSWEGIDIIVGTYPGMGIVFGFDFDSRRKNLLIRNSIIYDYMKKSDELWDNTNKGEQARLMMTHDVISSEKIDTYKYSKDYQKKFGGLYSPTKFVLWKPTHNIVFTTEGSTDPEGMFSESLRTNSQTNEGSLRQTSEGKIAPRNMRFFLTDILDACYKRPVGQKKLKLIISSCLRPTRYTLDPDNRKKTLTGKDIYNKWLIQEKKRILKRKKLDKKKGKNKKKNSVKKKKRMSRKVSNKNTSAKLISDYYYGLRHYNKKR